MPSLKWIILACIATSPAAANIVVNGNFETGDLTGWYQPGFYYWSPFQNGDLDFNVYAGNYSLESSCGDPGNCPLTQTLPTVPGQRYDLSFAFNPGQDIVGGFAAMNVYWGGKLLATIGTAPIGSEVFGSSWAFYVFRDLRATSSATDLTFNGYQWFDYQGLDNVSVTAAPIPPATLLFMTGAALLYRRRLSAPA